MTPVQGLRNGEVSELRGVLAWGFQREVPRPGGGCQRPLPDCEATPSPREGPTAHELQLSDLNLLFSILRDA